MSVPSVHVAKERLKTLLLADRMQCTPETAEKFSSDIYHTISKYMEIKPDDFHIQITRTDIHIKITGEDY
ncbi:cell division topological specificity factor MinE [Faecalicatena contorta]|jgi:cell division topological specificity factor|uniref:Cell division topological specificity factor n=1 Tax=Faecalicatena contorta TaxID=39482 RepID=A0A316A6C4_9FIRM|nr:cell division topological specificity factor MinE [Faecalicatena contorta]MBA4698765.1 cell division topological specificity factor MinE [Ruminococcus sp.]PWJ52354.1 cell division topological specificity factor [Faecalicatena contorta]SUQ12632.1 cell division topological specificity factor [Faecalicatena contorta]